MLNFYKELNPVRLINDKSYESFKHTLRALSWTNNIGVKNPPPPHFKSITRIFLRTLLTLSDFSKELETQRENVQVVHSYDSVNLGFLKDR